MWRWGGGAGVLGLVLGVSACLSIAQSNADTVPDSVRNTLAICGSPLENEDTYWYADRCSENKSTISILIDGRVDKLSAHDIGKIIADKLKKDGIKNPVYLTMNENNMKVSITFFMMGDQYGPYGGNNWGAGYNDVVLIYHARKSAQR
jgi:hypothetical protein